ncbi:MAG: enoyl-CoA hydratase/isomerase family protein [Rhodobacteraceae bacterium]|nr:enoyl-CoA hydratase/isomerase family protein [Paracoccaceae bacterium]
MSEVNIRAEGRAGRITLNRPHALNALTHGMCRKITSALTAWQSDREITLILIDATGDRAFCAGGDIAEMYETGRRGDFSYGRTFWADEYRMNAQIAEYPKPVVSFLHGFTMGGGVGVGCLGSHRIVGESAQIAMPECSIGLIPDVGGSAILATAPGRLGEYLGITCRRMGPSDAILAGFADGFVPEAEWKKLLKLLVDHGDVGAISTFRRDAPAGWLEDLQSEVDRHFAGETLGDIVRSLKHSDTAFAAETLKAIGRVSPLSAACTVEMIHRIRAVPSLRRALEMEYRFTYRSMEMADFLEGIRAKIIDKDHEPRWRHDGPEAVPAADVARMLMPLGDAALNFEGSDE